MPPTEPPGAEPASSTEDAKPSGPEIADAGRQLGTDLVEVEQSPGPAETGARTGTELAEVEPPSAGESEQTTRSSPDDAEEAPSRVGGASLGSVFEGLEVDGPWGPALVLGIPIRSPSDGALPVSTDPATEPPRFDRSSDGARAF